MTNIGLIDLYKVYSLEKMSELSKRSLAMQYEQCGQIMALRQQVANADATNSKILQNQIKELERQEKVRYYKNLIFNLKQAVEFIETIDDNSFKYYMSLHFCSIIEGLAKECVGGLEEISDKTFANDVLKMNTSTIERCQLAEAEYKYSIWNKLDEANNKVIEDDSLNIARAIKVKIKMISAEIESLESELKTSFSFLMRTSKKEAIRKSIAEKNEIINDYKKQIEELRDKNKSKKTNADSYYNGACQSRANWEEEIEKLSSFLPKPAIDKPMLAGRVVDSWFEKVARYFVNDQSVGLSNELKSLAREIVADEKNVFNNTVSTSMIQRKFGLGFNQATHLMEQFEEAGIVGPLRKDNNTRDLLICDNEDVDEIMKSLK